MFKKKPQIKNLSALRSSDRRKLADQIIAEYQIGICGGQETQESGETGQEQNNATLNSVRSALLPDNCLSARFTTLAGPDSKLISGTIYTGSHPGQEERVLWFQIGSSDHKLYPSVYTLWHNPGLVPLLHTQAMVVEKLQGGADLMTPGLARGPPFPERAKKNTVVAVASVDKPTVPAFVGVCEIDVSAIEKVHGAKGHAVKGLHWEGDELWAWGHRSVGGRPSPESLDGWDDSSNMASLSKGVENMALEEDDGDEGGVPLSESVLRTLPTDEASRERPEPGERDAEPSSQEIDQVFYHAFLYSLYKARKNGSAPQYGLDLPINPSFLISNLIQPYLPIHSTTQAQYYTIKKTSWKNTKKFIKHLDKQGLVKSKDRNGGETLIVAIDFDDERILDFTPYRLPKPKDNTGDEAGTQTGSKTDHPPSADPSVNQKLSIQILIRPSSKLVPDLLPSKTAYYTPGQVSSHLRDYLDQNPELSSRSSSPRFIKLNPFLAHNILSRANTGTANASASALSAIDTQALAAGEIARDILQKRLLEDTHLCQPYWVMLRDGQKWPPSSATTTSETDHLAKPKAGPLPKLSVVLEKRSGTKTVTKVANLDVFAIPPDRLAADLQRKCASSTSVAQWVGGKPGQMEVLVQGDQREVVEREVARRGVQRSWIDVLDRTGKKGRRT